MDTYVIAYLIIGAVVLYFIIDDIRSGEYSMIRFLVELIIIYGPIVIGTLTALYVFSANIFAMLLLTGLPVIFALTSRKCVSDFLYNLIPPIYDKMDIYQAIQYLKAHKSKPSDIAQYLKFRRGIQENEILKYLNKYFANNELQS